MLTLNRILDDAKKEKGHTIIRKMHCDPTNLPRKGCNAVLAVEITDKLGRRGECWVVKDALYFPTGTDLLYEKKTWYGNLVKCPNCGLTNKLLIDKPLTAEQIAQPKEVKDGKAKENNVTTQTR